MPVFLVQSIVIMSGVRLVLTTPRVIFSSIYRVIFSIPRMVKITIIMLSWVMTIKWTWNQRSSWFTSIMIGTYILGMPIVSFIIKVLGIPSREVRALIICIADIA